MTPAIKLATQLKLDFRLHEYKHEPNTQAYGLEAAQKLKLAPEVVFKTLVVADEHHQLAVIMLPVMQRLSVKKVAKALGVKKIDMADPKLVSRSTGYILGGVSPLGQKKRLPTLIDYSAQNFEQIFFSAGKRGLEMQMSPDQLAATVQAKFVDVLQD